ncbi:hypothetical protein HFO64_17100 [Rhizobium laguerreae]|nr:hypothetical protein [Rhizobium laguerreae]
MTDFSEAFDERSAVFHLTVAGTYSNKVMYWLAQSASVSGFADKYCHSGGRIRCQRQLQIIVLMILLST